MFKNSMKNALNEMNPDIVEESLDALCDRQIEKELTNMKTINFRKRIVLIAAAAAVALAAVLIPLGVMMSRKPEPVTPIVTDSGDSETKKQTTPTGVQPSTPTVIDPTKPTDDPTTRKGELPDISAAQISAIFDSIEAGEPVSTSLYTVISQGTLDEYRALDLNASFGTVRRYSAPTYETARADAEAFLEKVRSFYALPQTEGAIKVFEGEIDYASLSTGGTKFCFWPESDYHYAIIRDIHAQDEGAPKLTVKGKTFAFDVGASADEALSSVSELTPFLSELFGFEYEENGSSVKPGRFEDVAVGQWDNPLVTNRKLLNVFVKDADSGMTLPVSLSFISEDGRTFYLSAIHYHKPHVTDIFGNVLLIGEEKARSELAQGHFFGGHICPICAAEQSEVTFGDDSECLLMYFTDSSSWNQEDGYLIPFYAFAARNGAGNIAVVYVPAIELDCLDDDFWTNRMTVQHALFEHAGEDR